MKFGRFGIRAKLSIIFIGFLALVAGSVLATFLSIQRQSKDTLEISLVNRMSVIVSDLARSVTSLQTQTQPDEFYVVLLEIDISVDDFDDIQSALLNGGTVAYGMKGQTLEFEPITDADVLAQLGVIESLWVSMRDSARRLTGGAQDHDRSRAISNISFKVPLIHAEIDALGQYLEVQSGANLRTGQTIQFSFFLTAMILVLGGFIAVQNTIIRPLQILEEASEKITAGDLSGSTVLEQRDEIGALSRAFDEMRKEVRETRNTSEAWTEKLEIEVEQRTKELAALLEISADISSKLNLDRVLHSVVDKGRALLGGEVSVLCLLDDSHQHLSVASFSGPKTAVVRDHVPLEEGVPADVIHEGQTITCDACDACPILEPGLLNKMIAAPLNAGDRSIGAICVAYRSPGRGGDDASRLLTLLANSASIALENARLYGRVESTAALAERERIAAEMHDSLAQTLGYMNLQVDQAIQSVQDGSGDATREHLEFLQPAIQSAYGTVRKMLVGLSDNGISGNGFKRQLETSLEDFKNDSELEAHLILGSRSLEFIPDDAKPQILRIVQESLVNIKRHAGASKAIVTIKNEKDRLLLRIKDDGCGFDPENIGEDGEAHLGLKIMRGRAERVGGSFMVKSKAGRGTEVIVHVPLEMQGVKK